MFCLLNEMCYLIHPQKLIKVSPHLNSYLSNELLLLLTQKRPTIKIEKNRLTRLMTTSTGMMSARTLGSTMMDRRMPLAAPVIMPKMKNLSCDRKQILKVDKKHNDYANKLQAAALDTRFLTSKWHFDV